MNLKIVSRLSLIIAATATMANADEVKLLAGDRLIGTIKGGNAETIQMDTPYAEGLAIPRDQIESIATDGTVTLKLANGDYLSGQVKPDGTSERGVRVHSPQFSSPVTLSLVDVQTVFIGDPQALARESERVRLSGRANVGLSESSGNSDTARYHADGELRARTPRNRYSLAFAMNREEAEGVTTKDDAIVLIKYDHFLTDKSFLYSNASFEQDEFQGLDLRSSLGIGAGYQFFEDQRRFLSVEGGVSFVSENFDMAEDDEYAAARLSLDYEQQLLTFLRLFHFNELLQGLEDSDDLVVRSRTGLRFGLGKGLRATTQVNYDWDKSPAPGRAERDETYLLTLGYEW